jgi:CRISPR-associated protein Csb2
MPASLVISVRLLERRYHGKEWPPAPARLFQALVAGGRMGAPGLAWGPAQTAAFEWLEALAPPLVHARSAHPGTRYRTFVPNNSLKSGLATKTEKPVQPWLLSGAADGVDVLYQWAVELAAAGAHQPVLDEVCSTLRALGWGVDFATAECAIHDQIAIPPHLESYVPCSTGGARWLCPCAGLLRHLEACHGAFLTRITRQGINPFTLPTRFSEVRYRKTMDWQRRRHIVFQVVPGETPGGPLRWDQGMILAGQLRHHVAQALRAEEIDTSFVASYAEGHDESTASAPRLSYVPLPSIGFIHSDGAIRRVMIVEPPESPDREVLDLLAVKLPGSQLEPKPGTPGADLEEVIDRSKVLPHYLRRASLWRSVTPVILHGHNMQRGQISMSKTDRLLRQAFSESGFPEEIIESIAFQTAPWWGGCGAASRFQVPLHLQRWPRLHVQVAFRQPIDGPVHVGIGRHYGIGLFAGVG